MSKRPETKSDSRPDYIERIITDRIEFDLPSGKTLVIANNPYALSGLETVFIQNTPDGVKVTARGHGQFKVEEKQEGANPHMTDYIVSGPPVMASFEDHLIAAFWGQFTWDELIQLKENKKFTAKVHRIMRRLAEEFDAKAVAELNGLPEITQLDRFQK